MKIENEFLDEISWTNPEKNRVTITVCALRLANQPEVILTKRPTFEGLNQTTLSFDREKVPIAIDVFDITVKKEFENLQSLLHDILKEALGLGATLSWCMIDGGLVEVRNLFHSWEIESTYAICLPKGEPNFAFNLKDRKGDVWRKVFEKVNLYIREQIPDVFK